MFRMAIILTLRSGYGKTHLLSPKSTPMTPYLLELARLHSWTLVTIVLTRVTNNHLDRDGNIDMAFPVCYPSTTCSITSEIWIAYNNQVLVFIFIQ